MQRKSTANACIYNVIPEEKRSLAESALEKIRNSQYSLETAMELFTTELLKECSKPVTVGELKDGHTYLMFSHSPMATRIRGNVQKANAGEVYLVCMTWDAKAKEFYCRNAWSGINYYKLKSGTLLVE